MVRKFPPAPAARALLASAFCLLAGVLLAVPTTAGAGARPDYGTAPECAGLRIITAGGELCTHGGDEAPVGGGNRGPGGGEGGAVRVRASGPSVAAAVAPAPCPGDGRAGKRVRVLYGYPKGTNNRIGMWRGFIRDAVALADANLDAATAVTAGQHYRLYCQDDSSVTVTPVKLKPIKGGSYSFNDVIGSLQRQRALDLGRKDYEDPRFVYSIFVDNIGCCYAPAGQGTLYDDDSSNPAGNLNNATWGAKYSMIRLGFSDVLEAGFWQHEVGHNLGAVQNSAPHASGGFHCYEESDLMCYDDGGTYFAGGGSIVTNCVAMPDGQEVWDCGADDYYAQSPANGSYLDDHWNLVDSDWLSWST